MSFQIPPQSLNMLQTVVDATALPMEELKAAYEKLFYSEWVQSDPTFKTDEARHMYCAMKIHGDNICAPRKKLDLVLERFAKTGTTIVCEDGTPHFCPRYPKGKKASYEHIKEYKKALKEFKKLGGIVIEQGLGNVTVYPDKQIDLNTTRNFNSIGENGE